mgnify:CR=1 FL=1
MNILVVDDDDYFANKLKIDLNNFFKNFYADLTITNISSNFHTVLDYDDVNLLFLDIDLNEKYNGINLATYIKSKFPNILLVFTSTHDDLVFPALSVDFFQFIRKSRYDFDSRKVFKEINNYLSRQDKKIMIKIKGRRSVIKVTNIKYILSIEHELFIKTVDNDYIIKSSLKKFSENLNHEDFVQIERGLIINLKFIKNIIKNKILTVDDETYTVGRKYSANFLKKYEEFLLK